MLTQAGNTRSSLEMPHLRSTMSRRAVSVDDTMCSCSRHLGELMRLGILDIGSTAARLELVDLGGTRMPKATASFKAKTRLSENTTQAGEVTPAGIERAVRAVRECMDKGAGDCVPIVAFGTSAVRDASNAEELREMLSEAAGVPVGFMSPRIEAELTYYAASRWNGQPGSLTTVDIGGGTSDVATGMARFPEDVVSFPFGAATLTREYLPGDPPRTKHIDELVVTTRKRVAMALKPYRGADFGRTLGQSKVLRQLTALTRQPGSRSTTLTRVNLVRWIPRLAVLSQAQRAELPGVSRSRAQRILAGAIVAESILRTTGVEQLEMCPWGLREGLVLRCAEAYEGAKNGSDESARQCWTSVAGVVAKTFGGDPWRAMRGSFGQETVICRP